MRTLIVGAGTIGVNLATHLVSEGHDVVLIDQDAERQARLDGSIDCQVLTGAGTSPKMLEAAGIRRCDVVIAVTATDEVNIVVCRLAEHYGVRQRLARLRMTDFSGDTPLVPLGFLGITAAFSPERLAVEFSERIIATPGAIEAADFADGRLALRGFTVPPNHPLLQGTLATVGKHLPPGCRIIARKRGDQATVPGGADILEAGDTAYVLGPTEAVPAMSHFFVPDARKARSVVIFGAGIMGVELARRLRPHLQRVVLFGPDRERARRAAEILDPLGVEVIAGSVLDLDLMRQVGVEHADHLVTLSDDDENNLMAALLYRKHGRGIPILMTQKNQYAEMFEMLGFPTVIEPRALATSAILRFLHGGALTALARLHRDDVDVIETQLTSTSPLLGKPLHQIRPPGGLRVAAVIGSEAVSIPNGDTTLHHGDRVLLVLNSIAGGEARRWLR